MTKEDIIHLGSLSRIKLTDSEAEVLNQEIDSILEYVSTVKDLAGGDDVTGPSVGARYNILREDLVTTTPGAYTKVLLKAMPGRDGKFMSVKKILNQPE